jgi:hypothetical protein
MQAYSLKEHPGTSIPGWSPNPTVLEADDPHFAKDVDELQLGLIR